MTGEENQNQMLAEAGFEPAWFDDVAEGDAIMVALPTSGLDRPLREITIRRLRSDSGLIMALAVDTAGVGLHLAFGKTYPCWIKR